MGAGGGTLRQRSAIFQVLNLSKGLFISAAGFMAVFFGNVNGIYKSFTKVTANMTMSVTTYYYCGARMDGKEFAL